MDWSMIFELINPSLLIVVAACWVLGVILKQTPNFPSWSIAYIIPVIAVLFSCGLLGISMESIIQGILAGSFAVFGHQLVKQGKEGAKKE